MTLTVPIPTTDLSLDEIRLGELDAWMRPDREGIFAKLRAEAPITFHAEPVPPPEFDFPQGPGILGAHPLRRRDAGEPRPRHVPLGAEHRTSATSRPRSRSGSAR